MYFQEKSFRLHLFSLLFFAVTLVWPFLAGTALCAPLPDLTVRNLSLDSYCFVKADIANIGAGPVPAMPYHDLLLMGYLDGNTTTPWCSVYLRTVDYDNWTAKPNGSARVTIRRHFPHGQHQLRLVIHPSVDLEETDTRNNELTKTLTCSQPLPDLAVTSIRIDKKSENWGCHVVATIKNIGAGWVPDWEFQHASLRYGRTPGQLFSLHDRTGAAALKNPGGQLEVTPLGIGVYAYLKQGKTATVVVGVDEPSFQPPHRDFIVESDENNNRLVKTLYCPPDFPTAKLPDKAKQIPRIPLIPVLQSRPMRTGFLPGQWIMFSCAARPVLERQARGQWQVYRKGMIQKAGKKGTWRIHILEPGTFRLVNRGKASVPFTIRKPGQTSLRTKHKINGHQVPAAPLSRGRTLVRTTTGLPLQGILAHQTLSAPATLTLHTNSALCPQTIYELKQGKHLLKKSTNGRFHNLPAGSYMVRVRSADGKASSSWIHFTVKRVPKVRKSKSSVPVNPVFHKGIHLPPGPK